MNFYLEPGNDLDFAYKTNKHLIKVFQSRYFDKISNEKFDGYTLCLNISPSRRIKNSKILGPVNDRVNKYINYTIRVSYKHIVGANEPKKEYAHLIEEALKKIIYERGI